MSRSPIVHCHFMLRFYERINDDDDDNNNDDDVLVSTVPGVDVLNNAMDNVYTRALPEKWVYVNVSVAPSTITITEYGVNSL